MNIDAMVKKSQLEKIPLIDVREPDEYIKDHIPGAVNIPLQTIDTSSVPAGSYLYCLGGTRAAKAQEILAKRGIPALAIGGISSYTGRVVAGKESV